MDIRQFRALVLAARLGSITAAARELHYTQQAVSLQISSLERIVGTALLERRPRGVSVTEAGWVVVTAAERVLGVVDGLPDKRRRPQPLPGDRLRVGVHHPGGWRVLSAWCAVYAAAGARPGVLPLWWRGIERGLQERTIDLAFGYAPIAEDDLVSTTLWSEPRYAWLRGGHPALDADGGLGLRSFLALPTWDIPEAPVAAREYWCAYAERGGPPRFVDECTTMEDVLLSAMLSDSVGLAPAGLSHVLQTAPLVGVPVDGLSDAQAVVVHRRDAGPEVLDAVALAVRLARELDGIGVPAEHPSSGVAELSELTPTTP